MNDAKESPRRRPLLILGTLLLACVVAGVYYAAPIEHGTPLSDSTAPHVTTTIEGLPIVNVHEHLQSLTEAPALIDVMDRTGVATTVLAGSSWFTITLNPAVGFTRYEWNNRQLLAAVKEYPGRFEAWPTLNPLDTDNVARLQNYVDDGATGVKLYLGHGYVIEQTGEYMFHTMPLDDSRMMPVYAFCAEKGLPICYHVNPGPKTLGFAEEFVAVLEQFPALKIICPHFMLSSIREERLRELLDCFPNLYSDISFGHDDFLKTGLKRISRDPERFARLFRDYPDRFMFGTDLVITNSPLKTRDWIQTRFQAYLDMLSKDEYTTAMLPDTTLRGLALPQELLERVLYKNYADFKAKDTRGTVLERKIDWSKMGVPRTRRQES